MALLTWSCQIKFLHRMPGSNGYYYEPVTFLRVGGAEVDGWRGNFDGRVQFANSSPLPPAVGAYIGTLGESTRRVSFNPK